jgi:hypothetical protein
MEDNEMEWKTRPMLGNYLQYPLHCIPARLLSPVSTLWASRPSLPNPGARGLLRLLVHGATPVHQEERASWIHWGQMGGNRPATLVLLRASYYVYETKFEYQNLICFG